MLKGLIVIIIIISAIGIYAIGFDDFIKLVQLFVEKVIDVISGWFVEQKEELLENT